MSRNSKAKRDSKKSCKKEKRKSATGDGNARKTKNPNNLL
jgi:hypothetical protein